jgi:dual specificity protein kinase YAK1
VLQVQIALSQRITETFKICNPSFSYSVQCNPRRPITKPSEGVVNDGWDNENADLIMHVDDVLVSSHGNRCVSPYGRNFFKENFV